MELRKCLGCMEDFQGYPCPKCGYDPEKTKNAEYALPLESILAGKYMTGKILGQGGFGITYIGWDLTLERKVAIKEYYPSGQVSRNPGTRNLTWYTTEAAEQARRGGMEMFLKEARKMIKVDGIPGIVRVLDLFQENGTAYIVMEFVQGITLKEKLQQTGPLPWDKVRDMFLSAIQTMEKVHQAGLVHRDLSPDNLMLLPDGSVKILDLGAAKDLSINSGASSMMVAKGGFSPLEQYTQRGGSGPWTDVYSMAATIYYTLTGTLPPNAIDRLDSDTLSWDKPALLTLPPQTLKALQKAMAVQSQNRTQSMEALGRELAGREAPAPNPAPSPKPKPIPALKQKWWMIPAAAACVLACLAIPLLQRGGGSKKAPEPSVKPQQIVSIPERSGTPFTATNFNKDTAYQAQLTGWTEHVSELPQVGALRTYRDADDQERCRIYEDLDGKRQYIITAEYDGDGNIISQRCYDENGNLQAADEYSWSDDGETVLAYREMDGAGNCLEEMTSGLDAQNRLIRQTVVGKNGKTKWLTTYAYKADGTYFATRTESNGNVKSRYWYDADDNLTSYEYYRSDGAIDGRYENIYDAQGRKNGYKGFNASGGLESECRYDYEGDLHTKEEFYWNGELYSTTTYHYNPYGELLNSTEARQSDTSTITELQTIRGFNLRRYSFDHGNSEYSTDSVENYDWQGQIASGMSYEKDGTLSSKTEYYYDEADEQTGSVHTYYADDYYTVNEYDADYNPVSYYTYNLDGTVKNWTEYEYDQAQHTRTDCRYSGNRKLEDREVHQYDDQRNELWSKSYNENGELYWEYVYTYDKTGVPTGITSTYYSSWNHSKTVTEYDGNWNKLSEKKYDANGKLIS